MSVRLSVVLCQASGASKSQADSTGQTNPRSPNPRSQGDLLSRQNVEGDLVARLIGCPGLDMSLIGSLENIDPAGTDRLLLDGLSGSVAILSWNHPEAALRYCEKIGVTGLRTPHTLDRGTLAPGSEPKQSESAAGTSNGKSKSTGQPTLGLPIVGNGKPAVSDPNSRQLYFFDLSKSTAQQIAVGLTQLLQSKNPGGTNATRPPKSKPSQPVSGHLDPSETSNNSGTADKIGTAAQSTGVVDADSPSDANPISPAQTTGRRPLDLGDATEWDNLVEELNDLDI